jgi:copper resistance protein D
MNNAYLLAVWFHIVAMAAWLGSMVFLAGIALPILRQGDPAQMASFLHRSSGRLRILGWACLLILGGTGFFQLAHRGMHWNSTPLILTKVLSYAAIVFLSVLHDFWIGPKAAQLLAQDRSSPAALKWRRIAISMGRLMGVLALWMCALGVFIVRGLPN